VRGSGVTINRTGPTPDSTGLEITLFRFDDELKGATRANYPQLTKEMNPKP